MSAEKEAYYRVALQLAIETGETILKNGGTSLDAVEAAVRTLEDDPLFNAGRGSVFTHDGKNEMDASIMDGRNLMAGAVSGIRNIKNPVSLARAVMEKTEHVFLSGSGAIEFARSINAEFRSDDYFFEQARYDQLLRAREQDVIVLDHTESNEKKFGTVGAVARDRHGNLAAATSTGGMTNKKHGRIGDTPIIGAGTYANDKCAISCTGHGEYFIRSVLAYDIACMMEYRKCTLQQACDEAVLEKLIKVGGEGGLIAIDQQSNVHMVFNSEGMYRASKKENEDLNVGIYKE
jgi:L-asparaginase / beta-aspartyl-peptidase